MKSNEERFKERVEKLPGEDGCWIWHGVRDNRGFGWMWDSQLHEMVLAQVFIYTEIIGTLPRWGVPMQVCHRPWCVRPTHLEPKQTRIFDNPYGRGRPARKVNESYKSANGLKTHCAWGHEYNEENTRVTFDEKTGKTRRNCRLCDRDRSQRKRHGSHAR